MSFFVGCIMMLALCPMGCSPNLEKEKCSFYLAYEYAYKPYDIESTDGIAPIYGFSIKGNKEEGQQLVLVYANGEKEELDVVLVFTPYMLKNSPDIMAYLSKNTQRILNNSSNDDSTIIILLKNGNSMLVDVNEKECIYIEGDTVVKYPIDYRRLIIEGMKLNGIL